MGGGGQMPDFGNLPAQEDDDSDDQEDEDNKKQETKLDDLEG